MKQSVVVAIVLNALLILIITLCCLRGYAPWLAPWMASIDNLLLLSLLHYIEKQSKLNNFSLNGWKFRLSKWTVWVASSAYLALTNLYYYAWQTGLIKYACMQEYTPSMQAHLQIVYSPLINIATSATGVLLLSNLGLAVFEVCHFTIKRLKLEGFIQLAQRPSR